ncbi:MAG: N-acetyl-gamma-glutamyl-phosphate reductase [Pseudomonadota bacterium]
MAPERIKVGIFGGSGLTGSELICWILGHPRLELSFVHSRHHAGEPLSRIHPHLAGLCPLLFSGEPADQAASGVDVVFLALGHGEAQDLYERLEGYSGTLIDLTMDHRLSETFVYGIPELGREPLRNARRIANPGCFATSAILAAAPICDAGLSEGTLFFSSVTGSSGAGIKPTATTHHPYRDGNLFAYKVFSHQHEPEIWRTLGRIKGSEPNAILTAHSGPFVRGIHTTLYARASDNLSAERWSEVFTHFYEGCPFIRIRNEPPHLKNVVGSNFCDLYVTSRGLDVIAISVLDNLVKGAVGQAIQNLNVAMGWDEKEGLWRAPVSP